MAELHPPTNAGLDFDPYRVSRPDRKLLTYYTIAAAITGPIFPFVFLPLYFKYHTLKYRFDESGVSMSYGILFRREVYLTYRRIQDIHLTRNIVQRWLGLATVAVQTASGSSGPEMSIDGILEAEALRDFLYAQMRGARGEGEEEPVPPGSKAEGKKVEAKDEALSLLVEIRDLLRKLKETPA